MIKHICAQRLILFFVILCVLHTPTMIHADDSQPIQKEVDQYINAYVDRNQFSGSVLIAQDGQVVVDKGYGMADYQFDIPNSPQTRFRIGSLTKQFTAMAIMMLQEQNLLNVDDPIAKYIPDYPYGEIITIHHLLTHTSGIPDHTELEDYNRDRRVYHYEVLNTIDTFKNKELEFTPGESFKYSNSGYILLGYIIEQVAHTTFQEFIEQNIFQPLGMVNSGFETEEEIIKCHANGYNLKGNTVINAAYRNISNAHASGALYSTVEDLYLWDRALYTEEFVSPESLDAMFTPYTDSYGYGWGIVDLFNHRMVGHNGETEGFRANITRFINDDVCIIMLSNCEQTPIGKMSGDLAAIIFGDSSDELNTREKVTVNPEILNEYVGNYELNPGFAFTISVQDKQLYCKPTGQDNLALHPESETMFFITEVDAHISFVRNDNNCIEALILYQGDSEISAKKVD